MSVLNSPNIYWIYFIILHYTRHKGKTKTFILHNSYINLTMGTYFDVIIHVTNYIND